MGIEIQGQNTSSYNSQVFRESDIPLYYSTVESAVQIVRRAHLSGPGLALAVPRCGVLLAEHLGQHLLSH